MSTTATLVLDFEQQQTEECGALLLEVPQDEVAAGDQVEFRLWGDVNLLQGWYLLAGTESLGTGTLEADANAPQDGARWPGAIIRKQFSFEDTRQGQFDFPITRIGAVWALTELLKLDANGNPVQVAARGAECLHLFQRKSYSCIEARASDGLYGSIEAICRRVLHYRKWVWTVPANAAGDQWFFLYDGQTAYPYRRFA